MIGSPETGSRSVCGENYVLQNPRGSQNSRVIVPLEHINTEEPYCQLWAPVHKWQNAFIERFNRSYREEVLDAYLFDSLDQVRDITESWLHEYNEERPHESLGRLPPLMFMPRQLTTRESTSAMCA